MSEKTLKSGDVEVNKKEFHASKQPIALNLVHENKIVTSDKFKHTKMILSDPYALFVILLEKIYP